MKTPAIVGFLLVASAVMLAVLLPIGVFFVEFLENPDIFDVETTSYTVGNTVHVNVTLTYNGSIPLKDFRYTVFYGNENHTASTDVLRKGQSLSLAFTTIYQGSGEKGFSLSFKVMGLYSFRIGVKNAS